jgi:hypothetical protein
MASSLYRVYDTYRLQSVFWKYWHALAAPVHMAAAHYGSAIESLQSTYLKTHSSIVHRRIVEDEQVWKDLAKKITSIISEANLPDAAKKILANKAQGLNSAPQSIVMERFLGALGLKIGALESDVWVNRNRAAHGGSEDADNASRLIRENKVLLVMINRILLALSDGGDSYHDFYSLGRPIMPLADPIRDDRPSP